MNKLSSHSLFHFTPKYEFLESILRNGFLPRYCTEKYLPGQKTQTVKEIAIPMICFCDIPLSQTTEHLEFYGYYGLGMTKEWILKNNIVPVHYAYENSPNIVSKANSLSEFNSLTSLVEKAGEEFEGRVKYNDLSCESKILFNLTYDSFYFKELEGITKDKFGTELRKKFYDEKEWRYIPTPEQICGTEVKPYLEGDLGSQKESNNLLISKVFALKFEPKDIKYIIVQNENEINNLMKLIENVFEDCSSYKDVSVLKSRIIDSERIKNDL